MAEVVTVACSIPNGVYLHIDDMREENELVMGGGSRKVMRAYPRPHKFRIFGPATPFGQAPKAMIVGAYALTPNVDKQFWDEWVKQNSESDMLKNKCLCAYPKPPDTRDWAKDHAGCESGLQPLNPDKDVRRPRPANPNLSPITTATERA
jgi:hypothetical protein